MTLCPNICLSGRIRHRATVNNDGGALLIWELTGEAGALAPTFSLRN